MLKFQISISLFLYQNIDFFSSIYLSSYIQNSRSEICHNGTEGKYVGNVTMCPECEKYCPYWRLDKSCSLSKVAYVFDNYGTVVFSIVMSIWGRFSKNTLTNGNTRNAIPYLIRVCM